MALEQLCGAVPEPRRARLADVRAPTTGELLDRALTLWFPGPRSATGEDMAEFQVHGGRSVVAGVLEALAGLPDFRLAEPGEFTRRAFESGKLDLTAAEGVADLVAASSAAQRRLALRQMGGALDRLYEGWRARLIRVLAGVEADIDFPDEDLGGSDLGNVLLEINGLGVELARHLADRRGERAREGFSVAIVGAPNVGKSSLLNSLVGREAAIVSALPGTTRDVVEVSVDLDGFLVTLADTAGLREGADDVEREGVRRALARAERADLRVVVIDPTAESPALSGPAGAASWMIGPVEGRAVLLVASKADMVRPDGCAGVSGALAVSAVTGEGLAELRRRLVAAAREAMETGESAVLSRARHREALTVAAGALERCNARLTTSRGTTGVDLELLGEDLRLALRAIGRITGRVDVEDMLDVVFREFCIGK
jgi:tRNA modification GTPase